MKKQIKENKLIQATLIKQCAYNYVNVENVLFIQNVYTVDMLSTNEDVSQDFRIHARRLKVLIGFMMLLIARIKNSRGC